MKSIYSNAGPITPSQDHELTSFNLEGVMQFKMDITINAYPNNEWQNIFHFGNLNERRNPAIFLYSKSKGLQIRMTNIEDTTWGSSHTILVDDKTQHTKIHWTLEKLISTKG